MVYFSVINFYKNDRGVFENGQKKMSKIEKPKKVFEKATFSEHCDHYALIHRKNNY
jgi:hypothetical protein